MKDAARLYFTHVMHRRLFPVKYRFVYRVFSVYLDIDRLDEIAAGSRLFSHNRWNLLSLHDKDHGARDGAPLRHWIDQQLARHDIDLQGGSVKLLCFPRVFGYGFNPLSLWYCFHKNGELKAVMGEVSNTFGESHGYLLHDQGESLQWPVRQSRTKCFHVSPFIGMNSDYHFRLSEPGEHLNVLIRQFEDKELMLVAAQQGDSSPFNDRNLFRALISIPWMSAKVIVMIHWQALKIWLSGGRFHKKPATSSEEVR